uniref:Myelin oligodendrocyte glycoprotein n=1 Tax=Ornithorhynchus anatinus TaxID=9258 RepID=A0A6I8P4Z8_ORNAN
MARDHGSPQPGCPTSLLLPLLLLLQRPVPSSGQFSVTGPTQPIVAFVGEDVELPCRLSPGKNASGMEVGWYRPPFSRVVHVYRGGKDQDGEQAPEFRGRTELVKEAIGEGRVALRLRHVRFSDEGGYTCLFRDHSYQEEAAVQLKVEDPFYWINPGMLFLIAVLPVLVLQVALGFGFLCLQRRLTENLHRTFDRHFLRVPCWKITLFVVVPILGPLVAMILCYNWLQRRLAGQFLEELSKCFILFFLISISSPNQSVVSVEHPPCAELCPKHLGGGRRELEDEDSALREHKIIQRRVEKDRHKINHRCRRKERMRRLL